MMDTVRIAALLLFPVLLAAGTESHFDSGWRFLKSDASGAEMPGFDDSAWRTVRVPHDWSIEGPFDQMNPAGGAGAFLPAGIGWYRKQFSLPASDARKCVYVDFDGVMANSDVWINGFHLGKRPYGYVSFRYDLTGHVTTGNEANVIAVRADNSRQPASRWYTGAGINRHVRLVVSDPVHLEHWTTVVTTPKIERGQAVVHMKSTVVNQSDRARTVALETAVISPDGQATKTGRTASRNIGAGQSADFEMDVAIAKPELWDIEHPSLYRAVARVLDGRTVLDQEAVPFGIREFHFDAATGFWLNGRNFKIKGVCLHGDAGALGTAVPSSAWARRLTTLREIGVNAVRLAHAPADPALLDLCDRMGFLVMDEMFDTWLYAKNKYDYHLYFNEWSKIDLRDTVMRDRNHPSVILYSAGNEIRDTPQADSAKEILTGLVNTFHQFDPTRPVTQALFRPNVSHDYDDGLADILDVVGQNYRENEILAAHARKPSRKIIGTENGHDRKVWLMLRDNPPYAGQFLWSGIDYLGESRAWPVVSAESGLLDRTGAMKPAAYERQSWWSAQPMVKMARRVAPRQATPTDPGYEEGDRRPARALFLDWTPRVSGPHNENVEVYSNCAEVELVLNGKSLGVKALPADASARVWTVPFEAGTIQAVGRNAGKVVASDEMRTAGKALKVMLSSSGRQVGTAWDDVGYVTASVVDENGVVVPGARESVSFQVNGGALVAVDSADSTSHEGFQVNVRRTFEGQCVAVVRCSGGAATVSASAPGLAAGSITLMKP